jgi:hypothetical protein
MRSVRIIAEQRNELPLAMACRDSSNCITRVLLPTISRHDDDILFPEYELQSTSTPDGETMKQFVLSVQIDIVLTGCHRLAAVRALHFSARLFPGNQLFTVVLI